MAPGIGVAPGQMELDITIGNVVSAGWACAAGKVTASTLDVLCAPSDPLSCCKAGGSGGSLSDSSFRRITHDRRPFTFPEESQAEVLPNRPSC